MRQVTYAGHPVVTTDRVATSLVALTAALAARGLAEAVRIPVFDAQTHGRDHADLVVGFGSGVLSVGAPWPTSDPDTGDDVAELERRMERLGAGHGGLGAAAHYDHVLDDPDLGEADDDVAPPPIPLRPRDRR